MALWILISKCWLFKPHSTRSRRVAAAEFCLWFHNSRDLSHTSAISCAVHTASSNAPIWNIIELAKLSNIPSHLRWLTASCHFQLRQLLDMTYSQVICGDSNHQSTTNKIHVHTFGMSETTTNRLNCFLFRIYDPIRCQWSSFIPYDCSHHFFRWVSRIWGNFSYIWWDIQRLNRCHSSSNSSIMYTESGHGSHHHSWSKRYNHICRCNSVDRPTTDSPGSQTYNQAMDTNVTNDCTGMDSKLLLLRNRFVLLIKPNTWTKLFVIKCWYFCLIFSSATNCIILTSSTITSHFSAGQQIESASPSAILIVKYWHQQSSQNSWLQPRPTISCVISEKQKCVNSSLCWTSVLNWIITKSTRKSDTRKPNILQAWLIKPNSSNWRS